MSDKELLELAAEAAGIVLYVKQHEEERVPPECHARVWDRGGKLTVLFFSDAREHPMCRKGAPPGNVEWNPLTDDGDALRLAVKLDLSIDDACVIYSDGASDDRYAATRRAIVRAAASIRRAGKES